MNLGIVILILTLIVLIILVVLFMYLSKTPQWNQDVANSYPSLVQQFGSPDLFDPKSGGVAIWYSDDKLNGSPWNSVALSDEMIPHCCPAPHYDFLTCSCCMNISDKDLFEVVLSMSKSVWYDQLTNNLYVRCMSLDKNVASALLVSQILLENVNVNATLSDGSKINVNLPDKAHIVDDFNGGGVQLQNAYKGLLMTSDTNYNNNLQQLLVNMKQIGCSSPVACNGKANCSTIFNKSNVTNLVPSFTENYDLINWNEYSLGPHRTLQPSIAGPLHKGPLGQPYQLPPDLNYQLGCTVDYGTETLTSRKDKGLGCCVKTGQKIASCDSIKGCDYVTNCDYFDSYAQGESWYSDGPRPRCCGGYASPANKRMEGRTMKWDEICATMEECPDCLKPQKMCGCVAGEADDAYLDLYSMKH